MEVIAWRGLEGTKAEVEMLVESDTDDEADAFEKLRDRCFPAFGTPEPSNRFSLLERD